MALAAVTTLALTASAHSLTFEDGFNEGWAEQHGPQFLFAWSEDDVATVRRALDKLEYEHERDPQVIDDYLLGREQRIKAKLEHPNSFMMYGMMWDIDLVDAAGKPWRLQPMSLPETTLTGFAVSRDRYCRPEQLDTDNEVAAERECRDRNTAAIALYGRIEKVQHMTPGGKQ